MEINQIPGYQSIINEIMSEHNIKPEYLNKIDQLIRHSLNEDQTYDVDIRLIIDGGAYIYED